MRGLGRSPRFWLCACTFIRTYHRHPFFWYIPGNCIFYRRSEHFIHLISNLEIHPEVRTPLWAHSPAYGVVRFFTTAIETSRWRPPGIQTSGGVIFLFAATGLRRPPSSNPRLASPRPQVRLATCSEPSTFSHSDLCLPCAALSLVPIPVSVAHPSGCNTFKVHLCPGGPTLYLRQTNCTGGGDQELQGRSQVTPGLQTGGPSRVAPGSPTPQTRYKVGVPEELKRQRDRERKRCPGAPCCQGWTLVEVNRPSPPASFEAPDLPSGPTFQVQRGHFSVIVFSLPRVTARGSWNDSQWFP